MNGSLNPRKFYDLHVANKSQIAGQALDYIGQLYGIERKAKELNPVRQQSGRPARIVDARQNPEHRRQLRQAEARPIIDALHRWMQAQRLQVPDGSATAKALNYSLNRWAELTRYLDDGAVPIDNWVENQIRPWALGRSNWLIAGSLRSGQRAAAVMSLIQSARLNGHEPYAYLEDILSRLPTQKNSEIAELLPHNWQPSKTDKM